MFYRSTFRDKPHFCLLPLRQAIAPSMNQTIYLKYLWKTEDIVKAYKYHRQSSTAYRIIDFAYPAIGIINIAIGLHGIFVEQRLESISSVIFGLFFFVIKQIQLYFYGRSFEKLNYENKQVEWEINHDRVIHRMLNLSESTLSWDLIHGILDTSEGFLLYPQQNLFYWLPKYSFADEEDVAQFAFIAQDKVKNWQQIK